MSVVEKKKCRKCQKDFDILQADRDFYGKISPTIGGYVGDIPNPTLCPDCRQCQKLAFRNERKLYRRQCDASKKNIISIYSPDKPFKVYDQKIRWSDAWDARDYGQVYDCNQSFSEQFGNLMMEVPRLNIMNDNGVWSENCEYCQDFAYGKNCYMCTGSRHLEDCFYCHFEVIESKDLIDCISVDKSQHCYQCYFSSNLFACQYMERSQWCRDSLLWFNLTWCSDCIACYNLTNQQFCYQNKQYTKAEYEAIKIRVMKEISDEKRRFEALLLDQKMRDESYQLQCHNSMWNYLFHCRNISHAYGSHRCEDSKFLFGWDAVKNSYDIVISWSPDRCYEWVTPDDWYRVLFSTFTRKSTNCYYVDLCQSCEDCFACIGLRNRRYCILNKQYTKEEYEKLVPQIIESMKKTGEWWEFFDPRLSPFGYNETIAQEHSPLTKESATESWFKRSEYEKPTPTTSKVVDLNNISTQLSEVPEDIVHHAIYCDETGEPFRIMKNELDFYRKHNIPLPRLHPDRRYTKKMESMR